MNSFAEGEEPEASDYQRNVDQIGNHYLVNQDNGQKIKIPDKNGINPNNMFMYTVQKGDTLYNIAKKYQKTSKS